MYMIYKDDPFTTAATLSMSFYGIDTKPSLHHIYISNYALIYNFLTMKFKTHTPKLRDQKIQD